MSLPTGGVVGIPESRIDLTVQPSVAPRVLAVLVTHDGEAWLPTMLDALEAQDHPDLEIVAVDNASTDASRALLIDRLGMERVLVADRDLGLPGAVAMALDGRPTEQGYVWILHDDVAFEPDALSRLVAALDDSRVAIVGPKLHDWSSSERLQSVGWTIDLTGRADSGVDPGEIDQGQRDQERRALYVSTAGMLVRRETFDRLGGFDRRYHLFRDDLDLCWRAWLTGHEVEVVPDAVGRHLGAASNYVRLGQTGLIGPRYFAERNTLATLLKNYGALRLPIVVVAYLLFGVAKVAGFLLTRRVSDAWQTVRAWLWNVFHLRGTLRLRREVQQARVRSDLELRDLFGRVTPRVRAYAEAIAEWVAGGDQPAAPAPAGQAATPRSGPVWRRFGALVARRPIALAAAALSVVIVGGAAPLLAPGELRGGQLAPWPASPRAFLADYLSGWHETAGFGTSAAPSPAQALLGLLQGLLGGSAYLAPRVLLVGSFAIAWLLALRAAQASSPRRVPRVAAATAYVLSPPALAALATGRVGALVVLAVLPGIVAGAVTLGRSSTPPDRAWRAVSAVVLLGAIGGSFEPLVLVVLLAGGVVTLLVSLVARGATAPWRSLAIRVAVAVVGPVVLLAPWSLRLLDPSGPLLARTADPIGGELWRWMALSPDLAGFPGLIAGAGFVLAGLLGLVLGTPRNPGLVASLWVTTLAATAGAWGLARIGSVVWPGLPLILAAGAYAGLLAVAFATADTQLARFGFGWRQILAFVTSVGVTVSVVAVAVAFLRSPWDAYALDDPALPAFIPAAASQGEPFRVLVLASRDAEVAWEVVPGTGATMAATGVPASPALAAVEDVVAQMVALRDPTAAGRLAPLNVRYVVVPPGAESAGLDGALRSQLALEQRPVAAGRVFHVTGWLPRAAVVDEATAQELAERGSVPEQAAWTTLERVGEGRYRGVAAQAGALVVAEADDGQWSTRVGLRTSRSDGRGLVREDGVPAGAAVEVRHTGGQTRAFEVAGQLLVVLLAISLALRPPRFARAAAEEQAPADERLPAEVQG